jgi:MinD-like ATPase involved in chromosome partitioning or flagellar assembly
LNLADELNRLARSALLVDADCYGGTVAAALGLLDESPGLAAACRSAASSRLDAASLAGLSWQLGSNLRVLTGIPRAERWPELRPASMPAVLDAARGLAEFTVIDCGFCLEADEEISYDSVAPRRNGATLAVLAGADVILAVGAADPLGLQRLVRGLADLRDLELGAPIWVVLNRVRGSVVPGRPEDELAAALQRFAGRTPAAFLPQDLDALDAALSVGQTLAEARPSSRLRRAIIELASALAGTGLGDARPAARRRRQRVR